MPVVINILLAIHVLVSLLIVLIVLMQRPKNEGLGAAFGGGMTDNLFGAQTTNVLQTITRWLGGIFFGLTLLLSILYVRQGSNKSMSGVQKVLSQAPAVAPSTPAANLPSATSAPVQVPAETPAATAPAAPDAKTPAEMKPADAAAPAVPTPAAPADAKAPAEAPKPVTVPAPAPVAPAPAASETPADNKPAAPAESAPVPAPAPAPKN